MGIAQKELVRKTAIMKNLMQIPQYLRLGTPWLLAIAMLSLSARATSPPPAPSATDAESFMAGIFAGYSDPSPPNLLGAQADLVFTPQLTALIHLAADQAHGEAGALDYDPVCGCQDADVSRVMVMVAARPHAAGAEAVVDFVNAGRHSTIRFDLEAVQGQWRIADVHDPRIDSIPSLREFLKRSTTRHSREQLHRQALQ